MKKIGIISVMAILCSCSAKLIMPTQSDVERVSGKYPGYTLAELDQGKTIYEQNCRKCHGLKKPSRKTETGWMKIVPDMVIKTNKKAGSNVIDAQAQDQLLKYLITMSSAKKSK